MGKSQINWQKHLYNCAKRQIRNKITNQSAISQIILAKIKSNQKSRVKVLKLHFESKKGQKWASSWIDPLSPRPLWLGRPAGEAT